MASSPSQGEALSAVFRSARHLADVVGPASFHALWTAVAEWGVETVRSVWETHRASILRFEVETLPPAAPLPDQALRARIVRSPLLFTRVARELRALDPGASKGAPRPRGKAAPPLARRRAFLDAFGKARPELLARAHARALEPLEGWMGRFSAALGGGQPELDERKRSAGLADALLEVLSRSPGLLSEARVRDFLRKEYGFGSKGKGAKR